MCRCSHLVANMNTVFSACLSIILSSLLIQHGVSGSKVSVQLQLSNISYTSQILINLPTHFAYEECSCKLIQLFNYKG